MTVHTTSGWRKLIEESRVHRPFFREDEGEYGINDSATLEIGILYGLSVAIPQEGLYALILCEAGYDARNIGGMRRHTAPHRRVALARL